MARRTPSVIRAERAAKKKKAAAATSGITGGQGGKKSRYQTKRATPITKPNESIVEQNRAKAKRRGTGLTSRSTEKREELKKNTAKRRNKNPRRKNPFLD